MDRRNMLKKFLVPRTAFVKKDEGAAVVEQHTSAVVDNQAVVFLTNWHAVDDPDQQLTLTPADDWFQTDGELFYRSGSKTGFLQVQNFAKAGMQNAFDANIMFRFIGAKESGAAASGYVGFCFGADVNNCSIDEKLVAGITTCGQLFIGAGISRRKIAVDTLQSGMNLNLSVVLQRDNTWWLRLKVLDKSGTTIDILKVETDQLRLCGGVYVVVQSGAAQAETIAFAAFRNIMVQQKQMAAGMFNSRSLHPHAEDISDATESFHHSYKITEQT